MTKTEKAINHKYYENAKAKKKSEYKPGQQKPKPSKADLLPDFREAIPTPDDLDDLGCKALANAIILRAAEDYYDVCNDPDMEIQLGKDEDMPKAYFCYKNAIESFLYSEWYGMLTDVLPETFIKAIKEHKKKGKFPQTPRNSNYIPDREYAEPSHIVKTNSKSHGPMSVRERALAYPVDF